MNRKVAGLVLVFACAVALLPGARATDWVVDAVDAIEHGAEGKRLLLVGEKHGTREIPDLLEALLGRLAADGPVLLGLEVPRTEHAALRRYLASDGGPAARSSLAAGAFWQAADRQHDGRRSHDMLDLIEAVRTLRVSGRDVAVLPYDVPPGHGRDHHQRDAEMAGHIRTAYQALPSGRLVVLAGNVHAMNARPSYAAPQMQEPMGAYLQDLASWSVDIVAAEGAFWACLGPGRCGPFQITVAPPVGSHVPEGDVFDLRVVLPRFSVGSLIGAAVD